MFLEPEVLIISNKFDFSTDFITTKLREFNIDYLRLNKDELGEYNIVLDPFTPSLLVCIEDRQYKISEKRLRSIYYRAPTFLRDIFQNDLPEEEQLYRTQWAAFVRSLIVFENIRWVNNPVDTYKAEMKPYQLFYARKIGFEVPETFIVNDTINQIEAPRIAIKSIDTAILSQGDNEAFVYTTILDNKDLNNEHYSSPFIMQKGLVPKIDIRITVIGNDIIPIRIISEHGIDDDWRKFKGEIKYEIFILPKEIEMYCLEFARGLNLLFCAIDMIENDNGFHFIEVNPTGEWAWLQKNTGYEFDTKIAKLLSSEN